MSVDLYGEQNRWTDLNPLHSLQDDPSMLALPLGIEQVNGIHVNDSPLKITEDDGNPDSSPSPTHERTMDDEQMASDGLQASDTASVHSMPIVHTAEPQPSLSRPSSSRRLVDSPTPIAASSPLPSSTRPHTAVPDASTLVQDQRDRRRSATDVRTSWPSFICLPSSFSHV